jgi:hypothetical protein
MVPANGAEGHVEALAHAAIEKDTAGVTAGQDGFREITMPSAETILEYVMNSGL